VSAHQPIDAVSHFCPWAEGDEKLSRQRLLNARNIGAAKAQRATNSRARQLMWLISSVAGDWVFARATADDLTEIANALVRLMLAAGTIERLEGSDGD